MPPLVNGQHLKADIVNYSDDDDEASKKLKPSCPDTDLIDQIVNTPSRQETTNVITSMFRKGKGFSLKTGPRVDEMAERAFDNVTVVSLFHIFCNIYVVIIISPANLEDSFLQRSNDLH